MCTEMELQQKNTQEIQCVSFPFIGIPYFWVPDLDKRNYEIAFFVCLYFDPICRVKN